MGFLTRCKRLFSFAFLLQNRNTLFSFFMKSFLILFEKQHPFSVFKDYFEDLLKSPVYFFVTLINFFGNLAMFIPIGFFSALLFRNATLKRSAIIGFGMSTFIEFAQYFIMRNTAVDDIILNTLGAAIGYMLFAVCNYLRRKRYGEKI